MCGLVGCIGNINGNERQMFHVMLHFDVIRGFDSTGILSVTLNDNCKIIKGIGTPDILYEEYPDEFSNDRLPQVKGTHKLLMGHNRWATVGDINAENAHPFERGNIIGCHNGTLTSWNRNKLPKHKEFEVDSDNIMYSIDKKGIEKTIPLLHGAWAITAYNTKEKELYIIRNKERPLYFVWNKREDCLFWASEKWMIEIAAQKCKVELSTDPYGLKEDTLVVVPLKTWSDAKPKNIKVIKDVVGFKPQIFTGNTSYNGGTSNTSGKFPPNNQSTKTETQNSSGDDKGTLAFAVAHKDNGMHDLKSRISKYIHIYCVDDHKFIDGKIWIFDPKQKAEKEFIDKLFNSTGWFYGKFRKINKKNFPHSKFDFYIERGSISEEMSWELDPSTGKPWKDENQELANSLDKDGRIIDGMGREITAETFKHAAEGGCIWCGSTIPIDEHGRVGWSYCGGKVSLLCDGCLKSPHVVDEMEQYTHVYTSNVKEN